MNDKTWMIKNIISVKEEFSKNLNEDWTHQKRGVNRFFKFLFDVSVKRIYIYRLPQTLPNRFHSGGSLPGKDNQHISPAVGRLYLHLGDRDHIHTQGAGQVHTHNPEMAFIKRAVVGLGRDSSTPNDLSFST